MSDFPPQPQKLLTYVCAACDERLMTGLGQRIRDVVTCRSCGTACALDHAVVSAETRAAVKVVPTGSAAIMRPI